MNARKPTAASNPNRPTRRREHREPLRKVGRDSSRALPPGMLRPSFMPERDANPDLCLRGQIPSLDSRSRVLTRFQPAKTADWPKSFYTGGYPSGLCRKWERDKRLRNNHLRESRRLLSQRPLALNLGRQRGGRTKAAVDNYPNRGSSVGSQVMG